LQEAFEESIFEKEVEKEFACFTNHTEPSIKAVLPHFSSSHTIRHLLKVLCFLEPESVPVMN
jgi:hypothetical protein